MKESNATSHRNRILFAALLALTVLFFGLVAWAHSRMPETTPIHFNFRGEADRFASKTEFTGMMIGIGLFNFVIFAGGALIFPHVPSKYWNLPHRDYWLGADQKPRTIADVTSFYLAMGISTILLFLLTFGSTLEVALGTRETLRLNTTMMVLYLAWIAALCVVLFLRFYRIPKTP